jgi:TPR repeat protein
MLVLLLASFLLAIPGDLASGSLQETPQAATGNAPAKLSAAEISDLQKRADSGEAAAQLALGKAYESGNGVPQRRDQAALWYRKAAEQGNANAQNALGVLYWLGDGVESDKNQAVQWYRKAARQGNANAMFNLGAAYYNGEGVGANSTLAFAWFLLSSEAGSSSGQEAAKRSQGEQGPDGLNDACLALGEMYEKGEDLPRDLRLATAWYRKAGERGHNQAQFSLALLSIAAKDYDEARHQCEKAAKGKYSPAYFCLGVLHQNGLGVVQNPKEAFRWYQQGARAGHSPSMQAVAQMYATGEGTNLDRSEALLWFLESGRKGNNGALSAAKKLRSSMTEKEWKDAKKKLSQRKLSPQWVEEALRGAGSPPTP